MSMENDVARSLTYAIQDLNKNIETIRKLNETMDRLTNAIEQNNKLKAYELGLTEQNIEKNKIKVTTRK